MKQLTKIEFFNSLIHGKQYAERILSRAKFFALFQEDETNPDFQGCQHWMLENDMAGWILTGWDLPTLPPECACQHESKSIIMLHSIDDALWSYSTDKLESDFLLIVEQLKNLKSFDDIFSNKTLLTPV